MEPENPLLDDCVLNLAGRDRPRICFLPTASGDAEGYIEKFCEAFPPRRARASHIQLFRRSVVDLRAGLLEQDVICVGGGNTANLLSVWRAHRVDRFLAEAWRQGVVLAGLSAGMLCWFEAGLTDSFGPMAPLRDGLGLLPGSACPHFDGEPERRPALRAQIISGSLPPGLAADDGAALHFVGQRLDAVVSSRPGAGAWQLGPGSTETRLEVHYLGQ